MVLIKFVTEVGTGIRVAFGPGVLWHIKKGWGQWVIFLLRVTGLNTFQSVDVVGFSDWLSIWPVKNCNFFPKVFLQQ